MPINGLAKITALTKVETGFPGKPKINVFFNLPNINGLPGRIATFQNISFIPNSISTLLTKSCFPTEAPPVVIRILYLLISFSLFFKDVFVSLAIKVFSFGSNEFSIEDNKGELEDIIPFFIDFPVFCNSFPVANIAIFGFLLT